MAKTFEEPRPTPVTVIGWAWIILGSVMLLSATGALLMQLVRPMPDPSEFAADMPFAAIWRYFPVLVGAQVLLSIVGIVAGARFLKLDKRARSVLEVASWILLAALIGFAIFWVVSAQTMGVDDETGIFKLVYTIVGVMSTVFYGTPIGLMIHHLRSDRVRTAVA